MRGTFPPVLRLLVSILVLIAGASVLACRGRAATGSNMPTSNLAGEPVGSVDRTREHVFFLASDAMRGRASGTVEYDRAARYVEVQLEELALEPLFAESYRQGFRLERQVFGRGGWVELASSTGNHRFDVLKDAMFMSAGRASDRNGPFGMVYVGLGIHEPEVGWNDYAGLDLTGQCAVLVVDTPADLAVGLSSELLLRYTELSQGPRLKAQAAAAHGASCVLGIPSPTPPPAVLGVVSESAALEQVGSIDADRRLETRFPSAVALSARAAQQLFDGQSVVPFPGGRPKGFALAGKVRFEMDVELRDELATSNVGALLPGTDPAISDEVIVLTAHIDGQGMRGTTVLNSANDNASSVAALLEAARLLAAAPARRSVAFLFTAGEEIGLLGAGYFVEHPPFELSRIELVANMEMIGKPARSERLHRFRVTGRISRQVDDLARTVESEVEGVQFDYTFRSDGDGRRLFRNSDHVKFFLRGIPTLYFYGGGESYHQPSDDPEEVNYPKVAKMAEVLVALVRASDDWSAAL